MEENRVIPEGIKEREYIKKYAGKEFYRKLRLIGVFGYVMFPVLFVASIWIPMTSFERLICLGLTLGIHLGKSRVCAYVLMGFSLWLIIVSLLLQIYVAVVGVVGLLISVPAILLFRKAYQQYAQLTKTDC